MFAIVSWLKNCLLINYLDKLLNMIEWNALIIILFSLASFLGLKDWVFIPVNLTLSYIIIVIELLLKYVFINGKYHSGLLVKVFIERFT